MPMGEHTTNFSSDNIDELLTSYIDKEIHDTQAIKFIEDKLKTDSGFFKRYKSELLTRDSYRERLKPMDVPQSSIMKVNSSIEKMIDEASGQLAFNHREHNAEESSTFLQYLKNLISIPVNIGRLAVPRYAFGIAVIILVIGIGVVVNNNRSVKGNPYITSGAENSVMVQAVNYFHKIMNGEMKPQIKSNSASEVKQYFSDKVNFPVYVPEIANYTLVGGCSGDCHQEKVAHLLYSSGSDWIYMYQVPAECLKNKHLQLPEPVTNKIISDKYYMDDADNNECSMTVWYQGNIICASVSTIPKQKMSTTFASFK